MGSLICPKPRRPGNINTHSNCLPLRNQAAVFISKGGEELFDLIGRRSCKTICIRFVIIPSILLWFTALQGYESINP
uniref:Uncharacterized protein n=1 Tax=Solanum tuberosum TaxID=4113 RepID=M1BQ81_SOLTU